MSVEGNDNVTLVCEDGGGTIVYPGNVELVVREARSAVQTRSLIIWDYI